MFFFLRRRIASAATYTRRLGRGGGRLGRLGRRGGLLGRVSDLGVRRTAVGLAVGLTGRRQWDFEALDLSFAGHLLIKTAGAVHLDNVFVVRCQDHTQFLGKFDERHGFKFLESHGFSTKGTPMDTFGMKSRHRVDDEAVDVRDCPGRNEGCRQVVR